MEIDRVDRNVEFGPTGLNPLSNCIRMVDKSGLVNLKLLSLSKSEEVFMGTLKLSAKGSQNGKN